jgi:hypothetical protein
LSGTPPPFAHDELVPAGSGGANHHRLEQADLPDGLCELVECLLVERPPRLPGVRRDRGDSDLLVVSSEDLDRIIRRSRPCLVGRRVPGRIRTARRTAVGEPRRFRDKRTESSA